MRVIYAYGKLIGAYDEENNIEYWIDPNTMILGGVFVHSTRRALGKAECPKCRGLLKFLVEVVVCEKCEEIIDMSKYVLYKSGISSLLNGVGGE